MFFTQHLISDMWHCSEMAAGATRAGATCDDEYQLKFTELNSLYQAASIERDRLTQLVHVLEKRFVTTTTV